MIVCHCHGVTDREIREAVRSAGAVGLEELGSVCDAGTGCGGCLPLVEEIVSTETQGHGAMQRASFEARTFPIL